MTSLVVLLRGINLGASRRIAMADLRAMLEDMGYEDVRTVLQSGNVVLTADDAPNAVGRAIEGRIRTDFGMDVDAMVRTAAELADVVEADPLAGVATDGSKSVVIFLSAEPDPAAVAALGEEDFAPEEFRARGRELYAWCPNGLQKSPVVKALTERLTPPTGSATARNWNTVVKLHGLLAERS
jgi:uncharacterized protein (DUF1697 family)